MRYVFGMFSLSRGVMRILDSSIWYRLEDYFTGWQYAILVELQNLRVILYQGGVILY